MIEIKLGPKHKVSIQRITLAQTEDKKEKGIVLSVMNDGNQGNQVCKDTRLKVKAAVRQEAKTVR